jgi:4-hydroxy-2-oxoheptanedioate aldolase
MRNPTKLARPGSWREALESPDALLGTFLQIPSPQLVEIIGAAGFDFVVLDLEHGEYDLSQLDHLQRAAELAGLWSVVRVPTIDPSLIGKALDFGADAVLVPHIETSGDAQRAVAAAKYPPQGARGSYPFMRATGYRSLHRPGWEAQQNEDTSVILLVEGERGVANIDEIVRVPGVTAVFVGPVDLSQALGLPGQLRHPKVEAFAHQIRATAAAAGLHASIFCNDIQAAVDYAGAGFKLIAFSVDAQIVIDAYRALQVRFTNRAGPDREG